jgi:AcrR family transcriptional regulator
MFINNSFTEITSPRIIKYMSHLCHLTIISIMPLIRCSQLIWFKCYKRGRIVSLNSMEDFLEEINRINPISAQSKEWIMASLLKLLSEKPYSKITITEIASAAQLARRTFYRNFDSKEDILDMYIQKLCDEYTNLLKEEKRLKIQIVAKVYFAFWNKHLDFLILMEKNDLLYMVLQKYNQYLPLIHKKFNDNKEEYQNNNTLEYVLAFSAGGFWNMLIKWVHEGAKKTPNEMAELINEILRSKLLE